MPLPHRVPGDDRVSAERLCFDSVDVIDDLNAAQLGSLHRWMKSRERDGSDGACEFHRCAFPVREI